MSSYIFSEIEFHWSQKGAAHVSRVAIPHEKATDRDPWRVDFYNNGTVPVSNVAYQKYRPRYCPINGTVPVFLRFLRVVVYEFEVDLLGAVAAARPEFEDPRVAPLPVLHVRRDLFK